MTATHRQPFKTLNPLPTLTTPGTPQRLSATDLFVRAVFIESAEANVGALYVAFSENDASSVRRHWLQVPGDAMSLRSDMYGSLNAELNLKDIWFDGENAGDGLVVTYLELTNQSKFI